MVPAYGDIMGRSEKPLTGRVPPCILHTHMHCVCNICAVHTPMAGGVAQHIYCICNAYATRRPPAHHRGVHVRTKPKPQGAGQERAREGGRAELHAGLLDIEARRRAAAAGCGCGCGCAIGWSTERAQGGRVGSAKPVGTGTARRDRTLEGDSRAPLPPARTLAQLVAESWRRSVALCTGCPSTLSAQQDPPAGGSRWHRQISRGGRGWPHTSRRRA